MMALRATLRTAIAERDAKELKVEELATALAETEDAVAPEIGQIEELAQKVD